MARTYADALADRLGKERVRIIVEAYRPNFGGGFRPATAAELKTQLAAYDGYPLYLFDVPHYVTPELVEQLQPGRPASVYRNQPEPKRRRRYYS